MKFVKTPPFLRLLFQSICFKINTKDKDLYLTFDDGPSEKFTYWILNLLEELSIKATFFCTGLNAKKHPLVIKEIIEKGHQIGSHGYTHKNIFFIGKKDLIKDIERSEEYLPKTGLYRPPYGKIAPWQIKWIKDKYNIILWDVLSYDFSKKISDQGLYRNVIGNVENGSIIVFHDNKQSEKILQKSLMVILKKLKDQGFKFKLLDSNTKEI